MEKLRENSQWYFDRSLTENYHFVFQLPWSSQFVRAARLVQTSIVSRIIKEPQQVRLFLSVVMWKKKGSKDRKPAVKNAVSLSGHHDSLFFISVFWRGFFFFFSSIMTTDWNQIKRKKKNTYTKFKTTSWQRRYAKKDIHMVETEAHTCSEGVCLTAFAWVETNNPHSHYTCFYVQEFFKRYMAEGKTFFFLFEFFFFPLPVLLKWTQTS